MPARNLRRHCVVPKKFTASSKSRDPAPRARNHADPGGGAFSNYVEHWLDTQTGHSGAPMYISKNGDRVIYLVHVKSCDDPRDCGAAKRLKSGSTSSICSWVEAWPSSFYPNVNC